MLESDRSEVVGLAAWGGGGREGGREGGGSGGEREGGKEGGR